MAAAAEIPLEEVAWELSHLVPDGREGVDALLDEADRRAQTFAGSYAGKVAGLDREGLRQAMQEMAEIGELAGRAGSYAQLDFSTDTADPARGALVQRVQERATAIQTKMLFFDLEWAALDDAHVERLLGPPEPARTGREAEDSGGLDFCGHHLRLLRRYKPHLLTEPEEKVLTEKAVSGRSAWKRLFEELVSATEVELPGDGAVQLDVALSRLHSPDRDTRRTTAEAVTAALEPGLRTRAYVFNTLVHDKAVDDRLRSYPHWLAARNLSNEASDESVRALVEAVRARYEIPRRWYRVKASLLGIDRLADYDRAADVTEDEEEVGWEEARELVLDSYSSFSKDLGNLALRFFEERWIDAPVRPGKRGGAFSASTVPSAHPYVMLNYTSHRRDVLTLAHELGHGVHQALAREQGVFHQNTPLTVAETASVFGETIVFGRLLERAESPQSRLALLAASVEDAIATVFRQVAMNRFEDLVHNARRSEGELAPDRFSELWTESQEELFGDSVEVTEGYRTWWSYVPHFIAAPGYVYAYAYGQLLALSVYARWLEEGDGFVPRYLDMLRAGGSRSPEDLGAIVGVDLTDPGFWDSGIDLVEGQLERAEEAARATGRVAA